MKTTLVFAVGLALMPVAENRVLIVERNLRFRAPAGNAALQEAMDQSFASSVLGSAAR